MMMTRSALFVGGLFVVAALTGFGCKDDGGNGVGNPGTGGSTAGSGGGPGTAGTGGGAAGSAGSSAGNGGSSAGGTGGSTPGFMSILPCALESNYMTGKTTIDFGAIGLFSYDPQCLKVPAGSTVTFSGDFTSHPLEPSVLRGAQTGNPITSTSAVPDGSTTKSFMFATPGFYAYFCLYHGPSDTGAGMAGVIWVQ